MANDGRWKVLEENMETILSYGITWSIWLSISFFFLYLFYVKTIPFHDSYPLND